MFNCAATDLNDKGVINLKRYSKYLYKKIQAHIMVFAADEKMPETFFITLLTEKVNIIKEHLKNR